MSAGLISLLFCAFGHALINSVDVCDDPAQRRAGGNTLKHCGPIERAIVTCMNTSHRPYLGTMMFDFIPELARGTAVISVPVANCSRMVAEMVQRKMRPIVFANDNLNLTGAAGVFVIHTKGEVFESHACPSHNPRQITAFRAHSSDRACNWLHFLQFSHFLHNAYPHEPRQRFLARVAQPLQLADAVAALAKKQHFAAFGFGKFRLARYHGDYVARHAFVELLRRRNVSTIDALGHFSLPGFAHRTCPGTYADMYKCLLPYRFAIVMENSNFPGYISEKLLNAFLATAVPVYFGAEDVGTYFNEEAMIVCRLTQAEIVVLRAAHRNNYPMLKSKTDAAIVQWALTIVKTSMTECVDRVVAMAADESAYLKTLTAHPLAQRRAERTYIDGYDGACQLVRILEASQRSFFGTAHRPTDCLHTLARHS